MAKQVNVSVRLNARAGKEERLRYALKQLIGPTRKEVGCISYHFYQSVNNKAIFISHEIWESQEAFEAHLQTPYIIAMEDAGADLLTQPLEITIMEAIE